jgi:pyrrolidone-carboxylate peptidase
MIYTFRTSPFKDELQKQFKEVFIFGSLKKDFEEFKRKIAESKPKYIIGIAKTENNSQFETTAINQFNSTKKINAEGKLEFNLHIPTNNPFKISKKASDSFCNWTMYKIAQYIEENKLDTKIIFIHLNQLDLPTVKSLIAK